MKRWPKLDEIFSFGPSSESQKVALGLGEDESSTPSSLTASPEVRWQKIKFDNAVRALIAGPAYLACLALWSQKAIPSIVPVTLVFATYGAVLFLINWMFMGSRFARKFDFVFASLDLIGMSIAIYYTGGTESALYFLYFIPLVVHAFHRDWSLVLYSGFGGVVLYAVSILASLASPTPAMLTNLGARLFFMLLTVSVACLALNLLRKKEEGDRMRILRLKTLTLVSRELHHVVSLEDLPQITTKLIRFINEGLGDNIRAWTRFLLVQKDSDMMVAFADATDPRSNLSQEIRTNSCPVMKSNSQFVLHDAKLGPECPTENFSFGSHICVPVNGTENESFGVLFAGSPFSNAFKEEDFQFLEFVARSLGLSIQRLHRMEELRKSLEMNSCVLAATMASARSADDTFLAVLDGMRTILKVEKATLMLWDTHTVELKTVKVVGPSESEERELRLRLGEGAPGKALEDGETKRASGTPQSLLGRDKTYGIKALLCVPLKTMKGEKLGVISAAQIEATEGFSVFDSEIVSTFAIRAALAIENALMHEAERARYLIPKDTDRTDVKEAA